MAANYPANAASQAGTSQSLDPTQMGHFRSFVTMLGDASSKDEFKLKAAQELSENFELITQSSGYQNFLELAMRVFLKVLQDGESMFISELNMQQVSANGTFSHCAWYNIANHTHTHTYTFTVIFTRYENLSWK